jgi:6-pyruvoyltetrahydropterin/6-carboxytetrahydropterin synthase
MMFPRLRRSLVLLILSAVAAAEKSFRLGIRDTFMSAHSFHNNPAFGPASGLHGATFTCDVEFCTDALHKETNWVIDIGKASEILAQVLSKYNYKNLDDLFSDRQLTTTEFMCRQIHADVRELLKSECQDFQGEVCVKLWESHKAWASFTAEV